MSTGQATTTQIWTQFDGLGRVNRSAKLNGETASVGVDQTDTCYDSRGHKSFETYPYGGPGWGTTDSYSCANTSGPPGDTFNSYDALDRPTLVTNSDGSVVTTSYFGNWTTVTDQAGRSRKSKTDALGRLVEVCEADPTTGALPSQGTCTYETDYQYDVLDDLTRVDQKGNDPNSADWRTRLFTYDSLGRLLTANNPETGTISYGYDADSNMTSKTAPNVNGGAGTLTTTYGYDALHRLTSKTFSDNSHAANYYYDLASLWGESPANPVGRLVGTYATLAGVSGGVGHVTSYDVMGRVAWEDNFNQRGQSAPNQKFTYTYNLDGSVNTMQYPSGRVVTYAYNVAQRPVSAVDTANGINYVGTSDGNNNAHYMAWGALGDSGAIPSAVLGKTATFNGINFSHLYNGRMQPQTITANIPGATIFSLGYQFNVGNGTSGSGSDNGNVVGITSGLTSGRSQTFTYDYLNRILTAQSSATSGNNCWGESFTYDMWANPWTRNVTKCSAEPQWPAPTNHNQMSGYGYDAAGNLTNNSGAAYNYDAENRLISAPGVTFDYDADGQRVQKATSSTAGTLYWYGKDGEPLVETDLSGNLKNEYVFFNGERVARRDSSANVFYYFEDELGSSRIITQANGTVCYDADLYPFGAEQYVYTNTCPQNYKFTGKERDAETGLDEFGARYYSSALGRFTIPDWAAKPTAIPYAKFGDPQTLNLYSYVENSPVNRADADGHAEKDVPSSVKDGLEWIQQHTQTLAQRVGNAIGRFIGMEYAKGLEQKRKDDEAKKKMTAQDYVNQWMFAVVLGTAAGGKPSSKSGSFSIVDWKGYPEGVPKPEGPFRLISGDEYLQARQAANTSNAAIHEADPSLFGMHVHEIQPVKFGGSPTDLSNKMALTPAQHQAVSSWWSALQRDLEGH